MAGNIMKPDAPAAFERSKRQVPIPEPMFGWCICREIEVTRNEGGSLYLPTGGVKGMEVMPEEAQRGVRRLRVVKISAEYLPPRSMNNAKTPFGSGDYVMLKADAEVVRESFPIMLPDGYVNVAIHSVSAWLPGNLAEQKVLDS